MKRNPNIWDLGLSLKYILSHQTSVKKKKINIKLKSHYPPTDRMNQLTKTKEEKSFRPKKKKGMCSCAKYAMLMSACVLDLPKFNSISTH